MKTTSLLAFFILNLFSFLTHAQSCGLPVCDIPAKIAELKAASQSERVAYYDSIETQYKNNRDNAVLENLIDFATEAYKLSSQIDASEVWIPTRMMELLNRSLLYILTQGAPKAQKFAGFYSRFIGGSQMALRFQVLNYWAFQLKNDKVTTAADLKELIQFLNLAAKFSDSVNDELYVSNLARQTATQTGLSLLRIEPYFEGVYKVKTVCHALDQKKCPEMDKFSIVLGDSWRGIQASFINTQLTSPVFEFNEVNLLDEKTIEGITGPLDIPFAPSSFHIEFDGATKSFKGTIKTPRTEMIIEVSGTQIVSPNELYQLPMPNPLVSIDNLEAIYTGQIKMVKDPSPITPQAPTLELNIKRYAENSFKATIRNSMTYDVLFDFPAVYYFRTLGVINLYGGTYQGMLKVTLAYRIVDGKPLWTGFAQSLRTGQYFHLSVDPK